MNETLSELKKRVLQLEQQEALDKRHAIEKDAKDKKGKCYKREFQLPTRKKGMFVTGWTYIKVTGVELGFSSPRWDVEEMHIYNDPVNIYSGTQYRHHSTTLHDFKDYVEIEKKEWKELITIAQATINSLLALKLTKEIPNIKDTEELVLDIPHIKLAPHLINVVGSDCIFLVNDCFLLTPNSRKYVAQRMKEHEEQLARSLPYMQECDMGYYNNVIAAHKELTTLLSA